MVGLTGTPIGATASKAVKVTREWTVAHLIPGMPEVYGTPYMIALMETTAVIAVEPFLLQGWVTVGTVVNVKHLTATPVGRTVTATATVTSLEENAIHFAVDAHDGQAQIGAGTHTRCAVEIERFMARFAQQTP